MKASDLRIKIQRQAEKLKSFHKKVREDKKKYLKTQERLRERLENTTRERDLWIRDFRAVSTKVNEKHETIIDLQRALLKVTDQREDQKEEVEEQKNINARMKVYFEREIKTLALHIDSLTPKKQTMLKTSAISKIIKNTGDKDGKELQEKRIPR